MSKAPLIITVEGGRALVWTSERRMASASKALKRAQDKYNDAAAKLEQALDALAAALDREKGEATHG